MANSYYSAAENARHETNKRTLDALSDAGSMVCPFCGEDEFDRIGLKQHLIQWCDGFREIG